ncbi:GNAT family N-acetyltransferase [Niabella sp.]|uniref:GNAT family N-acetyltransferase n=1 Tax=Niabella sp. TaxID=1962976 RepID=UPI0026272111|nr:GNAT family N-acetyltransferase [Niabella sp.]
MRMFIKDHIRLVKRRDLDAGKWNSCISNDPNGVIYGRTFFLDAVAKNWDGLVLNDYEAVMPLVWNQKYGLQYLYQPFFTNALGIFCKNAEAELVSRFLQSIPRKDVYWDIALKESNCFQNITAGRPLKITTRANHLLPLFDAYPAIFRGYARSAKRMVRKAAAAGMYIERQVAIPEVIRAYIAEYDSKVGGLAADAYERIEASALEAEKRGMAEGYYVRFPDGRIAAFLVLFKDERYLYTVLGGATEQGKQHGAFYQLIDAIIRDHSGADRILRFEGSDLPGAAQFFMKFGAEKISYFRIIMNQLPLLIRWLKK